MLVQENHDCAIILITVGETGEAEVASFLGTAQLFSRLPGNKANVLQATESWARPGNEAIAEVYVCHSLK